MNIGMHHLHIRKRIDDKHDAYPHPNRAIRNYDYLMYVVGTFSFVALLPQVMTLYHTHDVGGLSISTWSVLAVINVLWGIYAVLHRQFPILISNVGMLMVNLSIVAGILLYR